MKKILNNVLWTVVVLLIVAFSGCHSGSGGDGNGDSTSNDTQNNDALLQFFLRGLILNGFYVQGGEWSPVNIFELVNQGIVPSCFYNNAGLPYMACKLPPHPKDIIGGMEILQESTSGVFDLRPQKLLSGIFKLRYDEAIVMVGNTPPEMAYYSYRTYIYDRYYKEDDMRKTIFAALGDSINIETISTNDGTLFNKHVIIISTADMSIAQKISNIAVGSGYSPNIINTDIVPSEILHMGVKENSDYFLFIQRMALAKDKDELNHYLENPGIRVFRVVPIRPGVLNPYSKPSLIPRGTGRTEDHLKTAMEELHQAILDKYNTYTATELKGHVWIDPDFQVEDALEDGINLNGNNNDTLYLKTDTFYLPDSPDEFVIVYGVNHSMIKKSVYSNLSVYGTKYDNGVAGINNQTPLFQGSALEYIPNNPYAEYLYVWKITRNAGGAPKCLEVPISSDSYGIALDTSMFIGFRLYLEPGVKVGPDPDEVLFDSAIKFSK